MVMMGTHKPQQQATLTNKNKIPEILFRVRFRNSTEKILNPGIFIDFRLIFFCEDGSFDIFELFGPKCSDVFQSFWRGGLHHAL